MNCFFLAAACSGPSLGSKLMVTTSNSFPASQDSSLSALAMPLRVTMQSMGQSKYTRFMHHGLAAEVVGETDGLPRLVAKGGVEGDAVAQLLVEADVAQDGGPLAALGMRGNVHRPESQGQESHALHLALSPAGDAGAAGAPRPSSATSRIARAMGMRTTPRLLSTHP